MVFKVNAFEFVARIAQRLIQRNGAEGGTVFGLSKFGVRRSRRSSGGGGCRHGRRRRATRLFPHGRCRRSAHRRTRQRRRNGFEQLLKCDGFFEEVGGTDAGGLDSSVHGGVTAHHDDRHIEQPLGRPFLQ